MAHIIISVLCWLGLSCILGNIVKKYVPGSKEDKESFAFVMFNGCGAAIVFVPLLGILLAILSVIIPSAGDGIDFLFNILSPFGLPQD